MRKKFSTKTTRRHHHQAVMDAFSDSGELYTIRNQFYTNQHNKVKAYSLDEFSPKSIEGVGVSNQIDNCVGTGRLQDD